MKENDADPNIFRRIKATVTIVDATRMYAWMLYTLAIYRFQASSECIIDRGTSSKGRKVRSSLSQSRLTSNGRLKRTPKMFWSFIFRLAATHMNYREHPIVGLKERHKINSECREKKSLTLMEVSPREPFIPATRRDGSGIKGPQRMSTRCK